jgi:hypothetical protein
MDRKTRADAIKARHFICNVDTTQNYRLLGIIGSGAFGDVYEAVPSHAENGRFAIKTVLFLAIHLICRYGRNCLTRIPDGEELREKWRCCRRYRLIPPF